jgi:deoxycytidine triphosphate deaminase
VGNITLEIANLGPFHIILKEGDAIAQLTVARVTNPPDRTMAATSVTYKQRNVSGAK